MESKIDYKSEEAVLRQKQRQTGEDSWRLLRWLEALRVGHELYNLSEDIGETRDVAAQNPEVVQRLEALAEKAREDMGDALTHRIGIGTREPGRWIPPQ